MLRALFLSVALLCFTTVRAADSPDKSKYHLFNPTPPDLMRELSTDRPDKTESPFTVDAGHFQIESDLVNYAHDRDTAAGADVRGDSYSFGALNLKAGLCNFSDFQLVMFPYSRIRTDDRIAGTVGRQSGFGDIITRLKINLWGNDSGKTAGAIMPYVKWPTSQDRIGNRAIEGGIIIPVAFDLPQEISCGIMAEFDWLQDDKLADYHPEFVNTITFGHKIIGDLSGYIEFFSLASGERGSKWIATFDFGFTYLLNKNTQFDIGLNTGLTAAAPDLNPFIGFAVRF